MRSEFDPLGSGYLQPLFIPPTPHPHPILPLPSTHSHPRAPSTAATLSTRPTPPSPQPSHLCHLRIASKNSAIRKYRSIAGGGGRGRGWVGGEGGGERKKRENVSLRRLIPRTAPKERCARAWCTGRCDWLTTAKGNAPVARTVRVFQHSAKTPALCALTERGRKTIKCPNARTYLQNTQRHFSSRRPYRDSTLRRSPHSLSAFLLRVYERTVLVQRSDRSPGSVKPWASSLGVKGRRTHRDNCNSTTTKKAVHPIHTPHPCQQLTWLAGTSSARKILCFPHCSRALGKR